MRWTSGKKNGSSWMLSCSGLIRLSDALRIFVRLASAHLALLTSGSTSISLNTCSVPLILSLRLVMSVRKYPHCCENTRVTPKLELQVSKIRHSSSENCIQQTALQPQRHWQFGLSDSLARLWKVDVKDRTTRYFLQVGF